MRGSPARVRKAKKVPFDVAILGRLDIGCPFTEERLDLVFFQVRDVVQLGDAHGL
jgi:hypothetical protein